MKSYLLASLTILALGNASALDASPTRKDNSQQNRKGGVTALDQSNDPKDLEITRRIREELTQKEDLSTYAENVKIISSGGVVVLKGPVRTEMERQKIQQIAHNTNGVKSVKNELSVVP